MTLEQPTPPKNDRATVASTVQDAINASPAPILQTVTLTVLQDEVEFGKWDWIVPVDIQSTSEGRIRSFDLHAALEDIQAASEEQLGETVFIQIAY